MEFTLLAGLLSPVLPKLWDSIVKDFELRGELEQHIGIIKTRLAEISVRLEVHQPVSFLLNGAQREVMTNLRLLAHDMEDCMEQFRLRVAKEQLHTSPFLSVLHRNNRSWFARKLCDLKNRSQNIDLSSLGAFGHLAPEPAEPEEFGIVGVDRSLDDLLGLVQTSVGEVEEGHKVIAVVGPGGIGKTRLVRRTYDSVDGLVPQFYPLASVSANKNTAEDVLRAILTKVGVQDNTTNMQKQDLIQLLYESLTTRRYLIVVDDVLDKAQWDDIKSAFPKVPQVSSRVIVTTTIRSVANWCSSCNGCVYTVSNLDSDHSQTLFFTAAALSHSDAAVADSEQILKKCEGLPLALVSIGQFLLNNGGLGFWENAGNNLGYYMHTDGTLSKMKQMFNCDYASLNGHEKARLLYFSILDCANPISRNSLIRRWLAEGFVEQRPRRNCCLMVSEYSNSCELINRNIIKPTAVSNNGLVKRCRPSEMALEYISYKSMDEIFVAFPGQVPPPQYIRRFCMHRCNRRSEFVRSRLRTLVVSGRAGEHVLKFSGYKLLWVLDLEQCDDLRNRHLNKICGLLLLRYLSLGGGDRVNRIPRNIAKLQLLETLDLRKTRVRDVPLEIILLPRLTHLLGKFQLRKGDYHSRPKKDEHKTSKLEDFLSGQSNLETVTGFVTGRNRGFPQLMQHMDCLRKVKIWCDNDADRKNFDDLCGAIRKFIRGATSKIGSHQPSLSIDFRECLPAFLGSLDNCEGSLHSLKLHGDLSNIPAFVTRLMLINELCLSSISLTWDTIVNALSAINGLKHLKLVAETTITAQGDILAIQPGQFMSLTGLCLKANEMLPRLTVHDRALQNLETLQLLCPMLDGQSADQLGQLHKLKGVVLHIDVSNDTKDVWKEAARSQPHRPSVLFQGP